MEADRLQDITQELLIIRRGGQDPGGRYPELMKEIRETATHEQQVAVYASLAREVPETGPEPRSVTAIPLQEVLQRFQGRGECSCPRCRLERYRDLIRENALRLMTDGDLPAGEAVRQAVALERLIAKLPEGEG